MSDQQPQIPPMDEPPYEEVPPPAEQVLPDDAERGQRGPASSQTGAEQTGVDDAAPPVGGPSLTQEGFAAQGNQQAAARRPDVQRQAEQQAAPQGGQGQGGRQEMLGAGSGPAGAPIKDPETWVTGDQPATEAQKAFLDSLAREAGEQIPADLTKAEASEHIDRLQQVTGRGPQQGRAQPGPDLQG
ncbi:DUF3072 domain-containing protein [Arsenicicoccus dermatophilus]|uniref:DUF3072 domain-containing protein n=1 Tax=Arsenicicoccus dermatophilus TaxID=1076331 RepID=UPI0039174433